MQDEQRVCLCHDVSLHCYRGNHGQGDGGMSRPDVDWTLKIWSEDACLVFDSPDDKGYVSIMIQNPDAKKRAMKTLMKVTVKDLSYFAEKLHALYFDDREDE